MKTKQLTDVFEVCIATPKPSPAGYQFGVEAVSDQETFFSCRIFSLTKFSSNLEVVQNLSDLKRRYLHCYCRTF